jgi:membrane protein YqaA with SNARE-associated domain
VHAFLHHAFVALLHRGGVGLLILSAIDSSPLFLPFGNDLLMIAMTVRSHKWIFYYALMAAVGSVIGSLTVDVLSRKGGEKAFEKTVSPRRFKYIKSRVTKQAGWALAFASLMPPPFPYTPFVAGSAAFQYPRKRLLSVIFVSRFLRFMIDGALAVLLGRRLLQLADSRVLDYGVMALIALSVAVSAFAIYKLISDSRRGKPVAGKA